MENEAYKTCLRCLPAQATTAVEECDATKFNQGIQSGSKDMPSIT